MVAQLYDEKGRAWTYLDKVKKFKNHPPSEGNYSIDYPKGDDVGFLNSKNGYLNLYNGSEVEIAHEILFDIDTKMELPISVGVCKITYENGEMEKYVYSSYTVGYILNDFGKTMVKL